MRTRETLCENESDPAIDITRIPMTLIQDLAVESREAKHVLITIAVDVRTEVCCVSAQLKQYSAPYSPITYGHLVLWLKIPPLVSSAQVPAGLRVHSRNTVTIDKNARLVHEHIIRLRHSLNQTTRTRLLPTVDGNPEWTILGHTGHESCQNGQLTEISLNGIIGRRAGDGWVLQVWRSDVSGNEALGFELLHGDSGALWEEENVPVLVTHSDGVNNVVTCGDANARGADLRSRCSCNLVRKVLLREGAIHIDRYLQLYESIHKEYLDTKQALHGLLEHSIRQVNSRTLKRQNSAKKGGIIRQKRRQDALLQGQVYNTGQAQVKCRKQKAKLHRSYSKSYRHQRPSKRRIDKGKAERVVQAV